MQIERERAEGEGVGKLKNARLGEGSREAKRRQLAAPELGRRNGGSCEERDGFL